MIIACFESMILLRYSQYSVGLATVNKANVLGISVVRYPRYLDTYRRYLRDDTSIAKVTIYRGISRQ